MPRKPLVRVTKNFDRNLEDIQLFLTQNQAASAFDSLLNHLFDTVIPNLERFPEIGVDFLATAPLSVEGQAQRARLHERLGDAVLRQYIFGDYLLLYAISGKHILLLSIKHHRQLSFDLKEFWI